MTGVFIYYTKVDYASKVKRKDKLKFKWDTLGSSFCVFRESFENGWAYKLISLQNVIIQSIETNIIGCL